MKQHKYLIFGIIMMVGIIIFSFYSYYERNFSYQDDYYKIKEFCYEKNDINNTICSSFITDEKINKKNLEKYLKLSDPKKRKKEKDVISVTSEIVELTLFSQLQLFSPLIIIFIVVGTLQTEFTSGNFKNHLLREDYKQYLKKCYKIAPKAAALMPLSLIFIFFCACIFTNFNFDTSLVSPDWAIYNKWKYEHFFLYGLCICFIQFFISLLYAHIGILCVRKNKNKLVSIIMGYLMFILVYIFIYIVLYVIIINKILGFKELTDYFNIVGYWFFNTGPKFMMVVPWSFLFQIVPFIYICHIYKNKEKLVLAYEKQIS